MDHPASETIAQDSGSDSEKTEVNNDFSPPSPQSSVTTTSSNSEDSDDSDGYEGYELLAKPFFDSIVARVSDFQKTDDAPSPPATTDFSAFKAMWREKFDAMRAELISSHESELFITDPPLRALEIEILDEGREHSCPCCLADRDADIEMRVPRGITRDISLRAVCDRLYGEGVEREREGSARG